VALENVHKQYINNNSNINDNIYGARPYLFFGVDGSITDDFTQR